jgi:hypothetical protein
MVMCVLVGLWPFGLYVDCSGCLYFLVTGFALGYELVNKLDMTVVSLFLSNEIPVPSVWGKN